jgi:hypothetical protein
VDEVLLPSNTAPHARIGEFVEADRHQKGPANRMIMLTIGARRRHVR